jgi:hypothetical protein
LLVVVVAGRDSDRVRIEPLRYHVRRPDAGSLEYNQQTTIHAALRKAVCVAAVGDAVKGLDSQSLASMNESPTDGDSPLTIPPATAGK